LVGSSDAYHIITVCHRDNAEDSSSDQSQKAIIAHSRGDKARILGILRQAMSKMKELRKLSE